MRAICSHEYGGSDVLQLEEVEQPPINDHQLLVAVKAAGINPVDTYIRGGTNNYTTTFPHIPGMDGAGEVVQVGADVKGFCTGDRVFFHRCVTGSAADFTVCDPNTTYKLPDSVSWVEGACMGVPGLTAYRALFNRGHAVAGESVLIHGATGAVGTIAVQLAKAAGLNVTASAGTEEGERLLRQLGADQIVNHRSEDYLKPWNNMDDGFDLILEMLADVNLDRDLKALGRRGRVVVVGSRGNIEITPRDLMARDAAVMGMALFNGTPAEFRQISQALFPLLDSGMVKPVVRQTFALGDLAKAHDAVLQSGAAGNYVIDLSL
ncbi:MAG: NADPH:quinone reductase [Natronospirillum sp.]|uniref:NADPH:quinone reductase n=1 Tax=Natronospirillum sp. TaxID=2812955 RepID=UPI0025CCF7DB|nr:NADPH:quinone reductase [Natronospirillum sp.]MCH8553072.1 NADPH:quinone reductase [Natronospirillum sp.]